MHFFGFLICFCWCFWFIWFPTRPIASGFATTHSGGCRLPIVKGIIEFNEPQWNHYDNHNFEQETQEHVIVSSFSCSHAVFFLCVRVDFLDVLGFQQFSSFQNAPRHRRLPSMTEWRAQRNQRNTIEISSASQLRLSQRRKRYGNLIFVVVDVHCISCSACFNCRCLFVWFPANPVASELATTHSGGCRLWRIQGIK